MLKKTQTVHYPFDLVPFVPIIFMISYTDLPNNFHDDTVNKFDKQLIKFIDTQGCLKSKSKWRLTLEILLDWTVTLVCAIYRRCLPVTSQWRNPAVQVIRLSHFYLVSEEMRLWIEYFVSYWSIRHDNSFFITFWRIKHKICHTFT